MPASHTFRAKVWVYTGPAAWYFVTLPKTVARRLSSGLILAGFGSVPVRVRIGDVEWTTSIFPDSKSKSYVLPLKADVRRRAGIEEGSRVEMEIEVFKPVARRKSRPGRE